MKFLILVTISTMSLNVFSASEVGEDKKGECIYSNQSQRDAKEVVKQVKEKAAAVKEEPKVISM